VGPDEASSVSSLSQGVGGPWKWRGRQRICLLKGCECFFRPSHPLQRYCSPECGSKAQAWRARKAQEHYRRTERGRRRRREQSQRRRLRVRKQGKKVAAERGCVGHRMAGNPNFFSCCRPGCYEVFQPTQRSPHQRFCSPGCRLALRRVRLREEWYRKRFGWKKSGTIKTWAS
jgi:hypothetical protein